MALLTLRYSKAFGPTDTLDGRGCICLYLCVYSMPVFCHPASYFHTQHCSISSTNTCLGTALSFITLSICRACKTPIQEVCLSSLIKKCPNPQSFGFYPIGMWWSAGANVGEGTCPVLPTWMLSRCFSC